MSNTLLKKLEALKNEDWTIYRQEMYSLRPRDEETRKLYDDLYDKVYAEENQYKKYEKRFPRLTLEDISYNTNDVFITHTKAIEDFLYRSWGLTQNYSLPLIPKGSIARKDPKDIEKYPILSQIQAESKKKKVRGYLQVANVATPTRYQGSEVKENQKLYYLVEKNSKVTNREFYTVITRCHKIASVVIVYVTLPEKDNLDTFFGKPVKREKYLKIEMQKGQEKMFEAYLKQTQGIEIEIGEDGKKYIDGRKLDTYISKHTKEAYRRDGIVINGELILAKMTEAPNDKVRKPLVKSLVEKESYFDISYMGSVYRVLEKHGIDRIRYPFFKNSTNKSDYHFSLDIFSAYPTALAYEKLPIDGEIYDKEDKNKLNFYLYKGSQLTENCIICGSLADSIKDKDKEFLFSTDFIQGSHMGQYILEKAHKSKEDKNEIKERADYGWLQKKFLKLSDNEDFYILTETYVRELVMVAVTSAILNVIVNLKSIEGGYIQIDALHFNSAEKIDNLKKMMYNRFKEYDFRIEDKRTEEILYQSYRPLKTKKENRAAYYRKYRKEKRK